MPFYLEQIDVIDELVGCNSVLIVPCRFCPAASAAIKNKKPYFQFFRRLLKTEAYEQQITELQSRLAKEGKKTEVFRSRSLQQFVLCMWSNGRRRKLRKKARRHDAVLVFGCEAAVQTVEEAVDCMDCRVIQCMKTEGIMNVVPNFKLPGTLWIECTGISRVLH